MGTGKTVIDASKRAGLIGLYLEKRALRKSMKLPSFASADILHSYILEKHPALSGQDSLEKLTLTMDVQNTPQLSERLLEVYKKVRRSDNDTDFSKHTAVLEFALQCDFFDRSSENLLLPLLGRRLKTQIDCGEVDLSESCRRINLISNVFGAKGESEAQSHIPSNLEDLAILSLTRTSSLLESDEVPYADLPGLEHIEETRQRSLKFDEQFSSNRIRVDNSVLNSKFSSLTRIAEINPLSVFRNDRFFDSAQELAQKTGEIELLAQFKEKTKKTSAFAAFQTLLNTIDKKIMDLDSNSDADVFSDPQIAIVDLEHLFKLCDEVIAILPSDNATPEVSQRFATLKASFTAQKTKYIASVAEKCLYAEDYGHLLIQWNDSIDERFKFFLNARKSRAKSEATLLDDYRISKSPRTISRLVQRISSLNLDGLILKINLSPSVRFCCDKGLYNTGDFELSNLNTDSRVRLPMKVLHELEYHQDARSALATEIERLIEILDLT